MLFYDIDRLNDVFLGIGLDMEIDKIRAGIAELLGVTHRLFDHQMHIKKHVRLLAQRLEHRDPNGDIRHKKAVHHVKVEIVGAGFPNLVHLGAKFGKISG